MLFIWVGAVESRQLFSSLVCSFLCMCITITWSGRTHVWKRIILFQTFHKWFAPLPHFLTWAQATHFNFCSWGFRAKKQKFARQPKWETGHWERLSRTGNRRLIDACALELSRQSLPTLPHPKAICEWWRWKKSTMAQISLMANSI